MPALRNAILAIIAVLGLSLVALPFAVVACAPSAPPGQVAGPAEPADADATPENAATATATATTAATATSAATPTSTALANSKLEPMLNALSTQSQGAAGAQGATGQATRMVGVDIWSAGTTDSESNANWETIRQLVTDSGGAILGSHEYSIPVTLLPQLSAHSAVASVTAIGSDDFLYPNMSRALNNAVAVWQDGATPQEATAAYSALVYDDKILVTVRVADAAAFNRVEAFFTANKVYVTPEGRDSYLEQLSMSVLVPVPHLVLLSQVSGITKISDWGILPAPAGESLSPDAQAEINFYLYMALPPNLRAQLSPLPPEVWELEGIAPSGTPTPTPTSESEGRVGGASSATSNSRGGPTPTFPVSEGFTRHNANVWKDNGITGRDVAVGIIDWGFRGFNNNDKLSKSELELDPVTTLHGWPRSNS